MLKFSKGLVILDKPKHGQVALARALHLQAAESMALHLVSFCWNAMCEQKDAFDAHQRRTVKKEIMRQREAWLRDQILDRGLSTANVTTEIVWASDIGVTESRFPARLTSMTRRRLSGERIRSRSVAPSVIVFPA